MNETAFMGYKMTIRTLRVCCVRHEQLKITQAAFAEEIYMGCNA